MGLGSSCLDEPELADDTTTTDVDDTSRGGSSGDLESSTTTTGGDECDTQCVPPGTQLWMIVEDGPAAGADALLNVAVDAADRAFVTGFVSVPDQGRDIIVREVGPDGQTIWTQTYDGGGNESGWGIAVDPDDAILIAGEGSGTPRRAYIGRYRADGTLLWHFEREGSGFEIDVDAVGDLVVIGRIASDAWLAKYDADGELIWELTRPGPAGYAVGWDLAVDAVGDVIAIGSEEAVEGARSWLGKYTGDGTTPVWNVGQAGAGTGPNEGLGNAMAPDGDIIAVGNMSVGDDFHAWVAKYGPQGQLKWTKGHTGHEGGTANAHHVAVDDEGNIAVVGWKRAPNETFDAWVAKFSPDGDETWAHTQAGDADGNDRAWGVAVDSAGHVYAVGILNMRDGGDNLWMAKYAP
jgi:uncharacterized delta-60 repeat protein